MSSLQPPVAPQRPHTRTIHGTSVDDPWYWLRDKDDPETIAYLEAENAYCDAMTADDAEGRERLFEEIRARVQETDDSVPSRKGEWWYVGRTFEGKQYRSTVRWPADPTAADGGLDHDVDAEQVVLDENELAGEAEYYATGDLVVSPSGALVAYTTDFDGGERYTLRIRRIATGEDLADEVPEVSYGVAWAGDSHLFYLLADEAWRPYRVMRHEVGTPVTDDVCVFEETDEQFWVGVGSTRSEAFVVIGTGSRTSTEHRIIPTDDPTAEPAVVEPRTPDLEYSLDHQGDRFVVLTNLDAPDFRVMEAPVATPGREHWRELVPERGDGRTDAVDAFAGHLVVFDRRGGLPTMTVLPDDGAPRELTFDEPVYEAGPGANPEFDTDTLRFGYTSMVTPSSVYDEDVRTGERVLRKRQPVLGGYDPDHYASARLWATAADGTQVPVSAVWKPSAVTPGEAPAPLLLYGYGSYEIVMPAQFSSLRLNLLDRGVIFAIAHVRGGGEMGRHWYTQGKFLEKQNTFSDFVACAEHLVAEGWTTSDRMAARGGSAGGLLMGAVVTQRPDLFAAVVAEVPFVDNVNTMLDPSIPLTVNEYEEWGNPNDAGYYAAMVAYSPYENVAAVDYPAMLVTAGLNDPRVQYWEPAKWVAKLRATATGSRPLLLKTEMGAGHGGPSGRYDAWRDEAFVHAFVLRQLGVDI